MDVHVVFEQTVDWDDFPVGSPRILFVTADLDRARAAKPQEGRPLGGSRPVVRFETFEAEDLPEDLVDEAKDRRYMLAAGNVNVGMFIVTSGTGGIVVAVEDRDDQRFMSFDTHYGCRLDPDHLVFRYPYRE